MLTAWESSWFWNDPHKFEMVCFYNANAHSAGVGNREPMVLATINFEIILNINFLIIWGCFYGVHIN